MDSYKTINTTYEGTFKEKMSKFYSFAIPVRSIDEIKERLEAYQKQFYDARHVCYAYMLGHKRKEFRANDNGEPSGTAGKPILGVINSFELTDILIVVVRYFGGIKLGTGGLVTAYREAALAALEGVEIIEKTVDGEVCVRFTYPYLNDVMRLIKETDVEIVSQRMEESCEMIFRTRLGNIPMLKERLEAIDYTLDIKIRD